MIWKKISENENYSINELGQVRNDITNKIRKPFQNKQNNYFYIDLWKDNKVKKYPIHRLIAEAFIPNPLNKPTVDHIDGNRSNNSIDNLRWATYSEQNSRFNTNGVRSEEIIVTNINNEKIYFNKITDVAIYFSTTISNISQMLKKATFGKRGRMRGYKFEYKTKR